jgi:hypothetical protein
MKQAIRENRRGKVRVPEYMISDDAPEIALLRSRMEVYDITHDLFTAAVCLIGYAPEFDSLELGAQPPEYEAIFTRHNGGSGRWMTFRRRAGEDRRIDEWLSRLIEDLLLLG